MSYATPAQMLNRYDDRRLGDLVRDDNTRATSAQLITGADAAILQSMLDDGAGEIDTACLIGGRYTVADLQGLVTSFTTGSSDPAFHSACVLIRINCDLAYGYLMERRGYNDAELRTQAPLYAKALDMIDKLRWGERLFAIPSTLAVDDVYVDQLSSQITLISANTRIFGDLSEGTGLFGANPSTGTNIPFSK
jgi:phage gp36-like protein